MNASSSSTSPAGPLVRDGLGFLESGTSRSRTVSVACRPVTDRLSHRPREYEIDQLDFLWRARKAPAPDTQCVLSWFERTAVVSGSKMCSKQSAEKASMVWDF